MVPRSMVATHGRMAQPTARPRAKPERYRLPQRCWVRVLGIFRPIMTHRIMHVFFDT